MQLSWESVRWLEEHQGADRGRCGSGQVPALRQLVDANEIVNMVLDTSKTLSRCWPSGQVSKLNVISQAQ